MNTTIGLLIFMVLCPLTVNASGFYEDDDSPLKGYVLPRDYMGVTGATGASGPIPSRPCPLPHIGEIGGLDYSGLFVNPSYTVEDQISWQISQDPAIINGFNEKRVWDWNDGTQLQNARESIRGHLNGYFYDFTHLYLTNFDNSQDLRFLFDADLSCIRSLNISVERNPSDKLNSYLQDLFSRNKTLRSLMTVYAMNTQLTFDTLRTLKQIQFKDNNFIVRNSRVVNNFYKKPVAPITVYLDLSHLNSLMRDTDQWRNLMEPIGQPIPTVYRNAPSEERLSYLKLYLEEFKTSDRNYRE